jgi:ABC-type glycerol-3-phosphate transport system permease component
MHTPILTIAVSARASYYFSNFKYSFESVMSAMLIIFFLSAESNASSLFLQQFN